jgi:hypothetical protein
MKVMSKQHAIMIQQGKETRIGKDWERKKNYENGYF